MAQDVSGEAAPERDPAADLLPEDLVLMQVPSRARTAGQVATQPTAREVALMGMLGWVMMGLAIWHFTIFLPDRFWGGIVGAFVGSLFGAVVFGLVIYGAKVGALKRPGQKATDIAVVLLRGPGRADRHRRRVHRGHAPRTDASRSAQRLSTVSPEPRGSVQRRP